mmetsp:Transcript_1517/g.3677  ORF Transcript_1517/g.3677 Transcript_1517/m.3677 type:complete len:1120 (-) Transcript_1517:241-3600(-)
MSPNHEPGSTTARPPPHPSVLNRPGGHAELHKAHTHVPIKNEGELKDNLWNRDPGQLARPATAGSSMSTPRLQDSAQGQRLRNQKQLQQHQQQLMLQQAPSRPQTGMGNRPGPIDARLSGRGSARPGGVGLDFVVQQQPSSPSHAQKPGYQKWKAQHAKKGTDPLLQKDKVNKDVLMRIKETFEKAVKGKAGRLNQDEFAAAFKGTLQTEDGSDELALKKLFMRIDANSDETIDWDEFSNFMLMESQGGASIKEVEMSINFEQPEEAPVRDEEAHKGIITYATHITLANGADRYVTCSRDGMVKIWNAKDMKHLKTIENGPNWATCVKMLPTTRRLAVSSFSRSMKIYDLHTYELSGQISEIDYAPMAMDVWQPQRCKDAEMIVFGDGGGYVRLYEVRMNPAEDKNSADRYLDTLKWKFRHHTDWVTTVKYVEEMNAVISGSLDRNICVTDAEERVPLKVLEGHIKGVNTVDWSSSYKYIASGGQDRRIMLWNPFSKKSLATLTGHTSSVMSIVVNDNDFQIISLGADKQVKLWDVRNHKCIQTISDRQVYPADDTLMCMCYDFKRKRLLTGNQKPKLWQQSVSSVTNAAGPPVVRIIYNPNFNEAVTGDQGGAISVWHVPTGKLRYRFTNTHKGKQLTAINFDHAKRRLLTGAEDGEVKVWNFSSGACLCTLQPKTQEEVTAILGIRGSFMKHFLVAGWDRRVTFYEDDGQKEAQPGRIISGHKADILDMDIMENSPTLVTVSDDGETCLWNIDSGALRRRIVPEGHEMLPANEQPIEAVRFLKEPLQRFFVTVGADRFLRIWDQSGNCAAEVGTGHKLDETVAALTVDATNSFIATGDSAGFIKVWDMQGFRGSSQGLEEASAQIKETALWRGHQSIVSSLDWVDGGSNGQFVLSSSLDRSTALWTSQGVLVGHFGAHLWFWDMPHSWASQTPPVLEMKEEYEMQVSAAASRQQARQRAQARAQQRQSSMHSRQLHLRQSEEIPLLSLGNAGEGQQGSGTSSPVREADQNIVSRLLSRSSRKSFARPEGLSPKHSMPGSAQQGAHAVDEDREFSLYGEGSESSSNHASDEDIPRALWLPDFELVRKQKDSVSTGDGFGVAGLAGRPSLLPKRSSRLG